MGAFLSHNSLDKEFAERLATDLKILGVDVWYGPWDIKVGESIVDKINQALSVNDYLVVVLSPNAVRSQWVKRELNSSLMRSLSKRGIVILPVLFKACKVPPLIADLKYADFTGEYEKGLSDLANSLGISSPIPAHVLPLRRIIPNSNGSQPLSVLFPFTFKDYPQCLFNDRSLDVTVILGSTEREKSDETEIFGERKSTANILGAKWEFTRQVSPATVRDSTRTVDLLAFLGAEFVRSHGTPLVWPDESNSICKMDVAVSENDLRRNLILVGGADTNVFMALASMAFQQKFNCLLPLRYSGEENRHFSCDEIISDLSNLTYSRLEDSNFMHCGYVLMAANPWAAGKVMILASGTRATGTQAALLALSKAADTMAEQDHDSAWRTLESNNRIDVRIPAKVLRATDAYVLQGNTFFQPETRQHISNQMRISQRHVVTGFEFLE